MHVVSGCGLAVAARERGLGVTADAPSNASSILTCHRNRRRNAEETLTAMELGAAG